MTTLARMALLALGAGAVLQAQPRLAPGVEAYLLRALEIMQHEALTSGQVDWPALRSAVIERAADATEPAGAYPAIRFALSQLGDGHSFLQLSDERREAERRARGTAPEFDLPARSRRDPSPFGTRMQPEAVMDRRGRRRVARVFMPQGRRTNAFATEFQRSIAKLDGDGPCGWIVDLRGNGGGDMWPMLAGLGPLLGDGIAGGSIGAGGASARWIYRDGEALFEDSRGRQVFARVEGPPYRVRRSLPTAVLIDRGTASSGEAMAIAFRGRPDTRLFGEPTAGASTATRGFRLSEGVTLVLAVAVFTDRTGAAYPAGVEPDDVVAAGGEQPPVRRDPVIEAALDWLVSSDSCRPGRPAVRSPATG
jgi:hypothetical protein